MRKGLIALLGAIAAAACTPIPVPPVAPEPVAEVEAAPAPAPRRSGPSRSAREAARDFIYVVERIEPVAESLCRQQTRGRKCDFQIVVDDRPDAPANAFQTEDNTGRPILAITLNLLREARNRDEIAFVLAHEAAHHIAGHLDRQRENAQLGAIVFGELAGVFGAGGEESVRTAQELGALVGARSYSKEFELEADQLGTIITAQAGFDPVRGAEFFFRIPDPGDQFLGTHPPNAARVAIVERTAAGL